MKIFNYAYSIPVNFTESILRNGQCPERRSLLLIESPNERLDAE